MAGNGNAFAGPPNPALIPAPPSPGAIHNAKSFAGVTIALNVVLFLIFGGRMWTRTRPVFRMGWDDYLALIAYPLVLTDSILLLLATPYVFGRDPATITLADTQDWVKLSVVSEPIWAWSMCAMKTSVTAMLLRVETEKFWRKFMFGLIAVQVVLVVYATIAVLTQCIPLSAAWDLLGLTKAKCWSKHAIRASSISVSTVNIATDIILALLPINFLRKVQRPFRERVIIGGLMALGILAAAASIVKCRVVVDFGATGDLTKEGVAVGMWTVIEEQIGLIAACVPCLRSPFQRVLRHFGLVSTENKSGYGRGYGQMYGDDMPTSRPKTTKSDPMHGTIKMKTLRSEDAHSEENILPAGVDGAKSGEIWCTTEVRMEQEMARQGLHVVKDQDKAASWSAASEHSQEDGAWLDNKAKKSDIV